MSNFLGFDLSSIDWDALLQTARGWMLPRLAESLLLLITALVLLVASRWLLRRLHDRFARRTKTQIDDILLMMVTRCLSLSIGFWALWRLCSIWGQDELARIVVTVWIVAFSLPVSRFVADILKIFEERVVASTTTHLDDTALPWVNRTVQFFIVGIAAMTGLHELGINITPLLAGASVAGFAISFAAKDTLANVISGVLLVLDRPFQVGDRIELWGAPVDQATWGDVVEIGLRATRIRTSDNITVIIPNSVITQRDIVNWTTGDPSIRLRIPIGVAYDAPSEKARAVLLRVADECSDVLKEPAPVAIIRRFGASSVDFELRVWIDDARQRRAAQDWITDRVKRAFDAEGIEIPYPKRDLYIKSMPGIEVRPGKGGGES